jgi:predicted HicB family RNase H-like nuclease
MMLPSMEMMSMSKKPLKQRAKEALAYTEQLADTGQYNWVEANNALFGPGGYVTTLFPTREDRIAFSQTEEYKAIAKLLETLPKPQVKPGASAVRSPDDVNGMVLLRVPKSLHAALFAEAEAEGISLNQLCLSKLLVQLRALVAQS